jgi:hypothetical protein
MKTRTKTSQEKREVARIEVGRKLLQLSVRRDEKLAKRSSVDIRIILMIRSQYGRLKGQAVVKRGVIENYASRDQHYAFEGGTRRGRSNAGLHPGTLQAWPSFCHGKL